MVFKALLNGRLYLDLARNVEHVSNGDINCSSCTWNNPQWIRKASETERNRRENRDYSAYCIIEIGQNIEKSSEDLRRLAAIQTPMKSHPLTLMWKTRKKWNNNNNNNNKVILPAWIPHLSFSILPYRRSPPASLPIYILCPHRADIDKFLLVGQHWRVHV